MSIALNSYKNMERTINTSKNDVFKFSWPFFVIGMLAEQRLDIVGQIFIGEILAIVYIFINYKRIMVLKSIWPLLTLGMVWAVSQIISDLYNQTPLSDLIKGVGVPILLILTIIGLSMFLMTHFEKLPSFLLGSVIGVIPSWFLFNEYFASNPWKWGVGQFVFKLFVVYFTFFAKSKNNFILIAFLMFMLTMGMAAGGRGMAIFPIFAALAYMAFYKKKASVLKAFKGRLGVVKFCALLIFGVIIMDKLMTELFLSPLVLENVSEESAEKYKRQASGEYGMLLGGRAESLASIEAFLDKPLLGHGSWAKDDNGHYRQLLFKKLFEAGYDEKERELTMLPENRDHIICHSYILGASVWAGIGGGLFWLYTIRWVLFQWINNAHELGYYFYSGCLSLLWNIFFSPFGAGARWPTAVFIAALGVYCAWLSKKRTL